MADFRISRYFPPSFDDAAAKRTLAELAGRDASVVADSAFRALLEFASGNSPYLARLMVRDSEALVPLVGHGPDTAIAALTESALASAEAADMTEAMGRLRVAKRRLALTVGLADLAGAYDLEQTTAALSHFADAAVKGALRFLLREEARRTGYAEMSPSVLEQSTGLVVLAMGKMGAFELNYSSDIDLVVFYDEDRFPFAQNDDKRGAAVNLIRGLVKLLSETTAEGYVFRVDLRLRPDAGATQIAIPTEAALGYYESMGQNWERAAMIKTRACAGDHVASKRFLAALAPFLWRKNLDFAAIEDIHSIKRQIHAHGGHAKIAVAGHNVKLGRGGIREIEFFAQTQQLILGGRDPSLRDPTTLGALGALEKRGFISPTARQELTDAYRFLRLIEHRLQMIDDQQTHVLPKTKEGLDHVARFAGFADGGTFEKALVGHLQNVQRHYAQLFEREAPLAASKGSLVFTGVDNDPETIATLQSMGFTRAADVASVIRGWHHGRIRATRGSRARELLTKLIPPLLDALGHTADPDAAFFQFDRFLIQLPAGVQMFSLLLANQSLLALIAEISGSAPRLAEYLGRNAAALDALIDSDFLNRLPERASLEANLAELLSRFPGFEGALDAARRFTREEMFRVGVHVIQGVADAAETGPAYAAIAETVIASLQPVVEEEVQRAYGRIRGGALAVVAQGKLGGREMTATSDLDLVFVYTHDENVGVSDGAKPLEPSSYYARVAQRFIAALTARTGEGALYEVDMRLRPSGNQGPVAVKFDTFRKYHRENAWTWERLALTRARVISGPERLRTEIAAAISAELVRPVDRFLILGEARAMREKLAAQFPGRDRWDVKFARGGLVDIEFVAQAMQLVHAARYPSVLDQNTLAALEKLASNAVIAPDDAAVLIAAGKLQHALTQILRIAVEGSFDPATSTVGLKALIARAIGVDHFDAVEAHLAAAQDHARAIFERLLPP